MIKKIFFIFVLISSASKPFAQSKVFYSQNFSQSTRIPSINTIAISSLSATTAVAGGTIISDGGSSIISKGVCWGTSLNPTINLSTKTNEGIGISNFSSNITGLSTGTTYHVRAFATNSIGTSYGQDIQFVPPLVVGSSYLGGTIISVSTGADGIQHGVIISPELGPAIWGNATLVNWLYGVGKDNTARLYTIQSSLGSNVAVNKLYNYYYSLNDWYIPSQSEIMANANNLVSIGLPGGSYITSNEISSTYAAIFVMYNGQIYQPQIFSYNKTWTFNLRAFRNF